MSICSTLRSGFDNKSVWIFELDWHIEGITFDFERLFGCTLNIKFSIHSKSSIRQVGVDCNFNEEQVEIIDEITETFCLPRIQVSRNNETDKFFEYIEKKEPSLSAALLESNSELKCKNLTIGQRRQILLDRAKFVRQKWEPNLDVYSNDESTPFKQSFNVLCSIEPQVQWTWALFRNMKL